ncbi:MAG: hypothetical protein HY896_04375 [Deltaproteobacteria bacterium]|nr:hypothetical protein [Deltaproteobacteria bacterium]
MKRIILAIFVLVFTGCATSPEITAWNMVREVNTPAAYKDFAQRYPQSGHADEARELIGKSEKERIMKAGSVAECVGIMKTNPDPKTAAMVGDLAFKAAQKETSVDALYEFLAYFKGHGGAQEVRNRLEELEFESARKDPSPMPKEYFLYRYPGSRFEAEGRKLLQETTFRQVKQWGNQYGYKAFLAKFPDAPQAAEVGGWIRSAPQRPGLPDLAGAISEAVSRSPLLRKHSCALALSSAIKENAGDPDVLRRRLYELEKGADSGALPDMCASAGLKARPDSEGNLSEALQALAILETQRKELAGKWEVYRERDEMVKAAIAASTNVSNELETAELSEEVLGSGPLGRVDTGAEKGSQSANRALERFQSVQNVIRRDKEDIQRMLLETESYYKPLKLYVTGCVVAK